jgi:hypothetical protein
MTTGAQRLRMSIHRCWTGFSGHSSWLPGVEVDVLGTVRGAAMPGNALLGC